MLYFLYRRREQVMQVHLVTTERFKLLDVDHDL